MRCSTTAWLIMASLVAAPLAAQSARQRDDVEKLGDPQNKMICRRFTQIGSLVANQKECHTKREWETIRQNLRERQGASFCSNPNGCG